MGFCDHLFALLYKNACLYFSEFRFVCLGVVGPILSILLASLFTVLLRVTETAVGHQPIWTTLSKRQVHGTFVYCLNSSKVGLSDVFESALQRRFPGSLVEDICSELNFGTSTLFDESLHSVFSSRSRNELDVFGGVVFDSIPFVSDSAVGNEVEFTLLVNLTRVGLGFSGLGMGMAMGILGGVGLDEHAEMLVLNQVVLNCLGEVLSSEDLDNGVISGVGGRKLDVDDFGYIQPSGFETVVYEETLPTQFDELAVSQPFFLATSVALLIPFFVHFATLEKEKGLKELLQMSGVAPATYWLSRLISDSLFAYLIIGFQWLVVGLISREKSFIENDPFVSILMCFLYPPLIVLFSYIFSFLFKKDEDAVNYSQVIVSLVLGIAYLVFGFLLNDDVPTIVQMALSLLPFYSFYYGLVVLQKAIQARTPIRFVDVLTWRGFGAHIAGVLLIIMVEIVVFFSILVAIEVILFWRRKPGKKNTQRQHHRTEEDTGFVELADLSNEYEDEENEEEGEEKEAEVFAEMVSSDAGFDRRRSSELLGIENVHKLFKVGKTERKVIRGVSFGVRHGEIYGLLGPNGAGKSTLLKMMTGTLGADVGRVRLSGRDIFENVCWRRFGNEGMSIVPQENVLWEHLSSWKHIRFFGFLRGCYRPAYTREILDLLTMSEDSSKRVKNLSGGSKRKLQLGMALIGEPQCLLLDEPTTGIDMRTRRFVWEKLESLKENRAILLTTHSMEEADSVCSRIGILVNGRLQCEGTSHQLKARYGEYYRFMVQARSLNDRPFVEKCLIEEIPNFRVVQSAGKIVHARVPIRRKRIHGSGGSSSQVVSLSVLFQEMEKLRQTLLQEVLVDYAISHATLEQVFMNFARHQVAPSDVV